MTTLSQTVAAYVHRMHLRDVPEAVQRIALFHFLDTIGCAVAAVNLPTSRMLAEFLLSEGGTPQASAIGLPVKLPATQTAYMNGLLARSLEFDDMAMPDLHPSGVIVPVVLAMAELRPVSGAEALAATALGIELCLRIAHAGYDTQTRSSRFLQRGQDSSAICGIVAASAIAARLLGLDDQQIAHAIGISVSMAGGLLEANRSGGTIKQFQSGLTARSCVQAAQLAQRGVTGPQQALEGRYGFYHCFVDGVFDPAIITGELGRAWRTLAIRYKPYPTNYYTHAVIDAALSLRTQGVMPDDIADVTICMATPMARAVGEPLDRKQTPRTAYDGKFSAPYTFTAALMGGSGLGVGIADFTDALLQDPARRAMMARIRVAADPRCDAIYPDQAPAIVTATLRDGRTLVENVMANRGSPERPLSDRDVLAKFRGNVAGILPSAAGEALEAEITGMAARTSLSAMIECLHAVPAIV